MKIFTGQHVNKIDSKGRISVPAPFRALVQSRGQSGVALYPSLDFPCIEGCGMDRIEKVAESLPDDPLPGQREEAIAHLLIGNVREALFDAGGRIVLPDDFLAIANLSDQATFVGLNHIFQIWEPAAYEKLAAEIKQRNAELRRARLQGSAP